MAKGYVFTLYTSNMPFLVWDFCQGPGQSPTETVQRLYGNRAVIMQSPKPPHGNCKEPMWLTYGGCPEMV